MLKRDFTRRQGPYRQEVRVGLGYIDKIPVADFDVPVSDAHGQPITERTEIGDAAFFFVDRNYRPDGTWHTSFARGLILQAKQAKTGSLPKTVPIVPLPKTQNDSTLKELALLSAWPQFSLYFTAASVEFVQKGYDIRDATKMVQPHAWYIGASPKVSGKWTPHWIAGPSQNAAPCNASLGELLYAILECKGILNGNDCVGKDFSYDPARLNSPTFELANSANPPDWSDLCHQLMLACNAYAWPSHLFGQGKGTRGAGVVCFIPIGFIFERIWQWFARLSRWRRGTFPRKGFPVVVVERISGEGPLPPSKMRL